MPASNSAVAGPVDQTSIADENRVFHRILIDGLANPVFEQVSLFEDSNQLANRFNQQGVQAPGSANARYVGLTKSALQLEIDNAFTNASSGDVVYIHFQARGGLMPDGSESGELNGSDEFLRLQPEDEGPDALLTDDELAAMVSGLPAGVALLVVVDSCYGSGFAGGADDIVEGDFVKVIGTHADCPFDPNVNLSSSFVSFTEAVVVKLEQLGVISGDDLGTYLAGEGWDMAQPSGSSGDPQSGKSRYDGSQALPTLTVDNITGSEATLSGAHFTPQSAVSLEVVTAGARVEVGTTMTDMNGEFSGVVADLNSPRPDLPDGYFLIVATDGVGLNDWQLQKGEPRIIYVDTDATGADNGTSWTDAYVFLKHAISEAQTGDQIWVAEGTYKPTEQSCTGDMDCTDGNGTCVGSLCEWPTPRTKTFGVINGVEWYGGFAGTEATLAERDLSMGFETILSGDVNGDDASEACTDHDDCPNLGLACMAANFCVNDDQIACSTDSNCTAVGGICRTQISCKHDPMQGCATDEDCFDLGQRCIDATCIINRHVADNNNNVVTDYSSDLLTIIDGFTVTGGNTNVLASEPPVYFNGGAGILAGFSGGGEFALATIRNCTIEENTAPRGGGIFSAPASETSQCDFENIVFRRNHAYGFGGALFEAGLGTTSNCLFEKNVTLGATQVTPSGGAINWGGNGVIEDCAFRENVAVGAAAVYASNAEGLLTNCCMRDNFAVLGNTIGFAGIAEPTITDVLIIESEEGTTTELCPSPVGPAPGIAGSDFFGQVYVFGGSAQSIDVTDLLTIGLNGSYEKNPLGPGVAATLSAGSVLLTNSLAIAAPYEVCTPSCVIPGDPDDATCCRQPLISLEDSMDIECSGDFVVDGAEGGPFGTIIPPPKLKTDGAAAIRIGGNLELIGQVDMTCRSSQSISIAGNFVNHSTAPELIDCGMGSIVMEPILGFGPSPVTFEVAGWNLGPTESGLDGNFSLGTLEVAGGVVLQMVDEFDNRTADTGSCDEALYVDTLIVGNGATLETNGCAVYYETLLNNGSIPGLGTDIQEITEPPIPTCAVASECADENNDDIRDDNCVWSDCQSEFQLCDFIALTQFADMGGAFGVCPPDGFANIHDRNHSLSCFAGTNPCDPINVDAGSAFGACPPDGFCNIHDANHALSAFAGTSTCSCPTGPMPELEPKAAGTATMRLTASTREARPGDEIAVRVFASSSYAELRSYQLDLAASGGQSGQLELVGIEIEPRKDWVFAKQAGVFDAVNVNTEQMLAGLDNDTGVSLKSVGYLVTYTYVVSKDAAGTFVIDIASDRDGQTYLVAPFDGEILIEGTKLAIISVSKRMSR
jgi:hypothetical protein